MAHPPCNQFCCSSFATFQDPFLDPSKISNLTNPIHPLFAHSQFTDISEADYHIIDQPLRLASKFLTLANVQKYIVIMIDGVMKKINNNGTLIPTNFGQIDQWARDVPSYRPLVARYARPEHEKNAWTGDAKVRKRANEILMNVREMVKFNVRSKEGTGADTRPIEGILTDKERQSFPRGCRNLVCIGRTFFNRMKWTLEKAQLTEEEKKGLLLDRFHFATVLVHETAHVLENVFCGLRRYEACYQGSSLSERGFEMEAQIFGGLLNATWSLRLMESRSWESCGKAKVTASGPVLVLYDWPSTIYMDMYRERRLKMGVRPAAPNRSSKVSRVQISFVEDLFTMEFWRQGRTSLQVPVEAIWYAGWSPSWDEIQPWMSRQEAQTGVALNSPKIID